MVGHLGRIGGDRFSKRVLFGELRKKRACHGPQKRWRDLVWSDLRGGVVPAMSGQKGMEEEM